MIVVRQLDAFAAWFDGLRNRDAAGRILARIRIFALVEPADMHDQRISELQVEYGPGYRIYLARHGDVAVLLLAGGGRRRQEQDRIAAEALRACRYEKRDPGVQRSI